MSIHVSASKALLVKGDYGPAEFYKGDTKFAGYEKATYQGNLISLADTYDAVLRPAIKGQSQFVADWRGKEGELSQTPAVWGTNLVQNGDFSDGATGWAASNCVLSAVENTLLVTGNASSFLLGVYQDTTIFAASNQKVYLSILCRVTNSECQKIIISIDGSVSGTDQNHELALPTINTWYRLSFVATQPADVGGNIRVKFYHQYADAATADGKIMEVQYVSCFNLTAIFGAGHEPTVAQINAMLAQYPNSWFDGKGLLTTDTTTYTATSPSPEYPAAVTTQIPAGTYKIADPAGGWWELTLDDDLRGISTYKDKIELDLIARWGRRRTNVNVIASYAGETIETEYMSDTGELTEGHTIYYVAETEIVTDLTLTYVATSNAPELTLADLGITAPAPSYPYLTENKMTGSLAISGKNLFDITRIENGTFDTSTGLPIASGMAQQRTTYYIPVAAGYIVQSNPSNMNARIFKWSMSGDYIGTQALTLNVPAVVEACKIKLVSAGGGFAYMGNVQLELGSTATAYAPYTGKTIVLPELGGLPGYPDIYEPNARVDGMPRSRQTQRMVVYTFTGSGQEGFTYEIFSWGSRIAYSNYSSIGVSGINVFVSSHFRRGISNSIDYIWGSSVAPRMWFGVDSTLIPDLSTWRSWLNAEYMAGTPVIVSYILAEPVITLGDPVPLQTYYDHTTMFLTGGELAGQIEAEIKTISE